MTWWTDLLTGIAQRLEDQGAGVYKPGEVYAAGDIAIVIGTVPPSPDRVIVLTDYDPNGGITGGDTFPRLQVRCRGAAYDPLSAVELKDNVRTALEGLQSVTFGTVTVSGINHTSGVPLGIDGNGRHERSDNYEIQARRESALLTE